MKTFQFTVSILVLCGFLVLFGMVLGACQSVETQTNELNEIRSEEVLALESPEFATITPYGDTTLVPLSESTQTEQMGSSDGLNEITVCVIGLPESVNPYNSQSFADQIVSYALYDPFELLAHVPASTTGDVSIQPVEVYPGDLIWDETAQHTTRYNGQKQPCARWL